MTSSIQESLNSVVRESMRNRQVFPDDQSAISAMNVGAESCLRSDAAVLKKWTMPVRNWKPALNQFTIEFGERVTAHLQRVAGVYTVFRTLSH